MVIQSKMMQEHVDRRKSSGPQPGGMARRATDQDLRGMQIDVDDSDAAWTDWEEASSQWDALGEDTAPTALDANTAPSELAPLKPKGLATRPEPNAEDLRLRP